jgi:uncharacterized protein (UPF0261 family)
LKRTIEHASHETGGIMNARPAILLIGTVDTKSDEIAFMRDLIVRDGGRAVIMDVGVLGHGSVAADIANTEVASAAGVSLQSLVSSGDENVAMTAMARGAALQAVRLQAQDRIDGLLALGGTMGTDLALDVANALPLGFPKVLVSTISYSHLVPPERVPPDLIMVLWAGGLHGLNSLCRSTLSQAAGAVMGAVRCVEPLTPRRPLVGMTSLGSSALKYMSKLKPALDARGFDLAVFHSTGMGGRAFEALASQGRFVAVMDFCLQELVNELGGSCVTAGPHRLRGASHAGTPQIVAPGATDMLDFPAWGASPPRTLGRPRHDHNRLIASVCIDSTMRREVGRAVCERLAQATGPTCLILPTRGVEEWDRPGQPMQDTPGLEAFMDETLRHAPANIKVIRLDAHINDDAFTDAVLDLFDEWVEEGHVRTGTPQSLVTAPDQFHGDVEVDFMNGAHD